MFGAELGAVSLIKKPGTKGAHYEKNIHEFIKQIYKHSGKRG
jgi:hypothetical protein